MNKIYFVVDSTACVSQDYALANNVKIVGLNTTIDGFVLTEGFEEGWTEFYEKLKASKNFPKTSQPTPEQFEKVYSDILNADENAKIVVLTISQSLSGTYNSALLASQSFGEDKILVIDSGQTGQSQMLFLEELVDFCKTEKSLKQIYDCSLDIRKKVCITFVPETIEYLKRGGRISLVKATIVNLFNIKPVLAFNDGVLANTKKGLGMQKTIMEVVGDIPKNLKRICIIYVHESPWIKFITDKVNEKFNLNITTAHKISPVVGSHVGIGAVGVAYITE